MSDQELDQAMLQTAANTVRGLSMDAVQAADSGHPGMPMGMADAAVTLWAGFLKHNPADPQWPDRDRFVLSAGHGSMLLYSLLHLSGYDLSLDELRQFRQWGSRTPGHPEHGLTPGVETTTGPLGQGIANAVGLALAEALQAARYNRPGFTVVDHHTYVIASDGDLMEGISHEACSLAGHLGLGKLIVLYDDNGISIDGPTTLSFSEDVLKRFDAYGWHTARADGHDPAAVAAALRAARDDGARPSIIACRTRIGFGSPNREGTAKAHGEPLGKEEVALARARLGLPAGESFWIADDVRPFMQASGKRGAERQAAWEHLMQGYAAAFPELAEDFRRALAGDFPVSVDVAALFDLSKSIATRESSGVVLNAIAAQMPALIGGSADLTPSNKTALKGAEDVQRGNFGGRYLRFGVREHGMAGILNGMALHGGVRPYGGTFLVFSDYLRPSMRLAALSELPVIYVFTHDSIGVGEDGPTHQPVEHLMALRAIPNLTVIRPGDQTETAAAWLAAINNHHGPTALIFSRQAVPPLGGSLDLALRGGYVLADPAGGATPVVALLGSGTETHLALRAQAMLAADGIPARVVSLPSWEIFDSQPEAYRQSVLPDDLEARVSIEAGITFGWERYVGRRGASIGIDRFGASAPYKVIYEQLGVTAEAMAAAARGLLSR